MAKKSKLLPHCPRWCFFVYYCFLCVFLFWFFFKLKKSLNNKLNEILCVGGYGIVYSIEMHLATGLRLMVYFVDVVFFHVHVCVFLMMPTNKDTSSKILYTIFDSKISFKNKLLCILMYIYKNRQVYYAGLDIK